MMTIEDRIRTYMQLRKIRGQGGATADEIALGLGLTVLTVRPAVTRMKNAEWLQTTGERRKNLSGRTASVLQVP